METTYPVNIIPLIVSNGFGVDSLGLLCEMKRRGIRPDVILHAIVGNEWPETYAIIPAVEQWLREVGFPQVTYVQYRPKRFKHGPYSTLEGNMQQNKTVPSISFGKKGCSMKWKGAPMDAWVCAEYKEIMLAGIKPIRFIGYDAGSKDRKRCGGESSRTDTRFVWRYPLIDWGLTRDGLLPIILEEMGIVPHKSACFFCGVTKKEEIIELGAKHPKLLQRALCMEDNGLPNLKVIRGLWGRPVKGIRDPSKRHTGNWREFTETQEFKDAIIEFHKTISIT